MSATAETNGRVTRNPLAPNVVALAEAPAATPRPIPPTLAAALSAFQGVVPSFKKQQTAEISSQKGSYSYDYADLGDILPITGPLLAEFGLAWTSDTEAIDGQMWLSYELLHISGESRPGKIPLGVPVVCKPQDLGSALTYMRRYAQTMQLNLATERDDDGRSAQGVSTVRPHAAGPQPTAKVPSDGTRPVDTAEYTELWDLALAAKLTAGAFATVLEVANDRKPSKWDASVDAANAFIKRELSQLRAAKIERVRAGIAAAAADTANADAAHAAAEGSQES